MEELRISCDVCEEAGFTDEAKFLETISEQKGKAYLVVERGFEYNDEIFALNEKPSPRRVFLDMVSALREAEDQNVAQLRRYNPLALCYGIEEISSRSLEELGRRISEILGSDFRLPDEDDAWELESLFPADASDEQMREIARLFDRLQLFEVIEVDVSV